MLETDYLCPDQQSSEINSVDSETTNITELQNPEEVLEKILSIVLDYIVQLEKLTNLHYNKSLNEYSKPGNNENCSKSDEKDN